MHLLSKDDRVELRRLKDNAFICRAPCGTELRFHESDAFILDGRGLLSSVPFQFRPRDGDVTLRVKPAELGPPIVGGVLFGVGGTTAAFAGFVYALDAGFAGVFCDGDPVCIAHDNDKKTSAGVVALLGLGCAVVGGLLLYFTHRTDYTVEE